MRASIRLIPHVTLAILAGGMISLSNAVAFNGVVGGWILILWLAVRFTNRRHGSRMGWAAEFVYLIVVPGCVMLAAAAPVKTRDTLLARRVVLPRSSMTLREVDDYCLSGVQPRLRTSIHAEESLPHGDQIIHWPGREMTLREFVAAVETQTPLRHRFGGCGNGSSILFGGNCCFGLSFRLKDRFK